MLGISCVTERLLASREGLSSMDLETYSATEAVATSVRSSRIGSQTFAIHFNVMMHIFLASFSGLA
jgi:hypothetical protein